MLEFDVNWTAHKQRFETVKSYMRHRKIPQELELRVEDYLNYLWATQKATSTARIHGSHPRLSFTALVHGSHSRLAFTGARRAEHHRDPARHAAAAALAVLQLADHPLGGRDVAEMWPRSAARSRSSA